MNPEAKKIFAEALEKEDEAREAFLNEACGEDSKLRREVEEMLVRDFEGSRRVSGADYSERGVVFRAGCRLARLLAPVQ